jgi:hypothetical protein
MKKLIEQLHKIRQEMAESGGFSPYTEAASQIIWFLESTPNVAVCLERLAEELPDLQEYQKQSLAWAEKCFGPVSPYDTEERRNRMLEEALELFQASGGSVGEANDLTNYVFGRPAGDVHQEAGGVGLTLSLLCTAHGVNLSKALCTELRRVEAKIPAIRAKQAARPKNSPLPGPSESEGESA